MSFICPVLEMGSHSVMPSTIPSKITFKTSINYQYIGLTKIVNNFKKDIEENIKELFMQDLENKFLNEGSEDNE